MSLSRDTPASPLKMDKLCDGAAHGRVVPFAILLNLPR